MSEFLFFLFPAAGAMLLVYGIVQAVLDARNRDKAKIMQRLQDKGSGSVADREKKIRESLLKRSDQEDTNPILQVIGNMSVVPRVQTMLDQANVEVPATKFIAGVAVSSVTLAPILWIAGMATLPALGVGCATMILPIAWLRWKRAARMTRLLNQLPDVFDMMGQALRAGHSLAGAIQLVSEQLPDPAGTEFARVFHEQNLGLRVEDALHNFANRCDQMDIRFFVTAVLIQRQTGGDLAEVLDNISSIIRGRIELFGQVKGLTAEGRLSGWVLLALPVVVFIASMYMNPEYANTLIDDSRGRMMLCVAGMMQLMGMAMIKKIVSIKV
jgi:tight adherence protein B